MKGQEGLNKEVATLKANINSLWSIHQVELAKDKEQVN